MAALLPPPLLVGFAMPATANEVEEQRTLPGFPAVNCDCDEDDPCGVGGSSDVTTAETGAIVPIRATTAAAADEETD